MDPWKDKLNVAFQGHAKLVSLLRAEPRLVPKGRCRLPSTVDEAEIKRMRRFYSDPERENQYHGILTSKAPGDYERPIFEYCELDYAALRVLETSQEVPALYAGAVVCCSARQEVYFHRRSGDVDRDKSHLHTMSGNFCPRREFRQDEDLRTTAAREIYEEMHVFIDVDAVRYPALLIQETFAKRQVLGREVFSGRWLLSYLGVDISEETAEHIRDSREGEVVRVPFEDLGSALRPRAEWMQTGLLNVLAWLAIGAKAYGDGPGFDPAAARGHLEQWFAEEAAEEPFKALPAPTADVALPTDGPTASGRARPRPRSRGSIEAFLSRVIGQETWARLDKQTRVELIEAEEHWTRKAIEFGAGRKDWGSLITLYSRAIEAEVREHLLPLIKQAEDAGACTIREPTLGGCVKAIRDIRKAMRTKSDIQLSGEVRDRVEQLHQFFIKENPFLESFRNRAAHADRDEPISSQELARWRETMFEQGLFRVILPSA
jgi:hypothetical protein